MTQCPSTRQTSRHPTSSRASYEQEEVSTGEELDFALSYWHLQSTALVLSKPTDGSERPGQPQALSRTEPESGGATGSAGETIPIAPSTPKRGPGSPARPRAALTARPEAVFLPGPPLPTPPQRQGRGQPGGERGGRERVAVGPGQRPARRGQGLRPRRMGGRAWEAVVQEPQGNELPRSPLLCGPPRTPDLASTSFQPAGRASHTLRPAMQLHPAGPRCPLRLRTGLPLGVVLWRHRKVLGGEAERARGLISLAGKAERRDTGAACRPGQRGISVASLLPGKGLAVGSPSWSVGSLKERQTGWQAV